MKENQIEIGSLDLIKVVCKKCQISTECPYIPLENYDEQQKDPNVKTKDQEG
ncbi:MAG: hypothetical protein ACE5HI_19170 [bacterium]